MLIQSISDTLCTYYGLTHRVGRAELGCQTCAHKGRSNYASPGCARPVLVRIENLVDESMLCKHDVPENRRYVASELT
jgi:hypothetical protein